MSILTLLKINTSQKIKKIRGKRKGQLSMELIMYTIISLVLFTTYFLYISTYIREDASQSKEEAAQNLIYKIAKEVNLVYMLGDGYHLNITLPSQLANNIYSLYIKDNKIILTYSSSSLTYIQPLIFNSTYLSFQPGRINEIYNEGGKVSINIY